MRRIKCTERGARTIFLNEFARAAVGEKNAESVFAEVYSVLFFAFARYWCKEKCIERGKLFNRLKGRTQQALGVIGSNGVFCVVRLFLSLASVHCSDFTELLKTCVFIVSLSVIDKKGFI